MTKLQHAYGVRPESGRKLTLAGVAIRVQYPTAMTVSEDYLEELRGRIIACAITVHKQLGPGLLESIYQDCLVIELVAAALTVTVGKSVPIVYRGKRVRDDLKLDLIVEDKVILEIKAVEEFHPVHLAQLISYLKLTGCPTGLLLNFNSTSLRLGGIRRAVHPDLYKKPKRSPDPLASCERRVSKDDGQDENS